MYIDDEDLKRKILFIILVIGGKKFKENLHHKPPITGLSQKVNLHHSNPHM
jgi:hypothetical protein